MDLSVVISAFSLLFLAEMGDKTQLAIIALVAGTGEIWSVFVGSTLALWVVSLIGILFGATLLRKIPRHWVHRAAALLFVTFGILALGQVILSENALGVAKNLRGQSMSTCENGDDLTSHLEQIQALYTELAETPDKDFGWGKGRANARLLGYGEEWLRRLPEPVWESAAAVGNPFSVSPIGDGQTIVDLGCGAGADACVAALLVGETGHVIGVDCTPQ